jgi:hypothetical protein
MINYGLRVDLSGVTPMKNFPSVIEDLVNYRGRNGRRISQNSEFVGMLELILYGIMGTKETVVCSRKIRKYRMLSAVLFAVRFLFQTGFITEEEKENLSYFAARLLTERARVLFILKNQNLLQSVQQNYNCVFC